MKTLNCIIFLIIGWLVSVTSSFTLAQSRQATVDTVKLQRIVDEYVEKYDIPSLSLGIIHNGEPHFVINRGTLKRGGKQKVDENSVFQIGSLSKTFSALIFNRLEKENKVSVDQSIVDFFKSDLSAEAAKRLNDITVGSVLNHTAGLPNNGPSVPPTPFGAPMKGGYTTNDFLKDLNDLTVDEDKNGKWSYSNFGFAVIGQILEKAGNANYESLLQKFVLEPYGMTSSGSNIDEIISRGTLVTPYHVHKRKKETRPWEMGTLIPAGGIFSSVNDLSRLMIEQLGAYSTGSGNNAVMLTKETVEISSRMRYGRAFFATQNSLDTTIIQYGHGGDLDGFASIYELYPEFDLGLVILTSSGGAWINEMKNSIEADFFGFTVRQEISLSKKELKRYEGKYEFESGQSMMLFTNKNQLMAKFKGADPIPLHSETMNKFFFKTMDSQIEFELDNQDKVANLIYIQNGQKIFPKRVK